MIEHFNRVMDYIEDNLSGEISSEKVTQIACTSDYHFRKMFSYLSGMTLTEYIKQRRFTLANQDLIQGDSVTQVAFKYGYQSVDGFSRAFKDWLGHSPSEVFQSHVQKHLSPFRFRLSIQGGISMEYKIEKKAAFKLVGVTKRVAIQFEGVNPDISELASSITPTQREHMKELGNLYPHYVLNASFDGGEHLLEESGELTHLIGFATSKESTYDDLDVVDIPELTWAIFPNTGPFPETLQDTWARTHSEWLPSSEYELVKAPQISFTKYGAPGEDVYSEIWLAVQKKK